MLSGAPLLVLAQDDEGKFPLEKFYVERKKGFRSIFKNFRFGLSVGYGQTYFSHQLKDSIGIYQAAGKAPLIFQNTLGTQYKNWVNKGVTDTTSLEPSPYLVRSDTAKIGFKGRAFNIPIRATIHYEFLGKYRIGGGYSYEYMNIGTMSPISYGDHIQSMRPTSPSGFMQKYFGSAGYSFYRWEDFLFTADLNIGGFKPGSNFANPYIKKGVYVNLGISAERELSEYLRLFARPSFEFKSYTLMLPEINHSIKHNMNAFYLNVGITYTIPELPKCFVKTCKIQINHAHGNKEYRSRVHPIYKKQNPGYGENNPPVRDQRKNRKKINPY